MNEHVNGNGTMTALNGSQRGEEVPVSRAQAAKDARLPDVAYTILGYVSMYPDGVHGYELGRALSRASIRAPSLRLGQLYRLLRRLERAELVSCRVEADTARLRYRFSITSHGETCFQRWLANIPKDAAGTCDALLERLRFAERMPSAVLVRLVDETAAECRSQMEQVSKQAASAEDGSKGRLYAMALKARLADDRCWLEEVRRLAQQLDDSAGSVKKGAVV
jgi:DNA-binding PadR family transcriptional regulator